MVVMRTPEMDAIKHCLELMAQRSPLDRLHDFAERHESSEGAGIALMQFLVGKCEHKFTFEADGTCQLCGAGK
jgi:hypothetical protein